MKKTSNIRLFVPYLGKEELREISDSFEKAWIGLGAKVKRFENRWNKYLGCKASLAVNSATAALHLSVSAFGFKQGKKVLVPSVTFASTAFAAVYNGLEPVFVDVDPKSITISVNDIEKKYSRDCVAIIPVHFGGQPAEMEKLLEFARVKNMKIIEDCAHTIGAKYKGRKLGLWGDLGCFSFEEKKAMTTGDGGMISSNDVELIELLRPRRWVGIDKDTWRRESSLKLKDINNAYHWYYEITDLGYKYNMNDLCASIGLAQLKKIDWMNKKRSNLIKTYLDEMRTLKIIKPLLPYQPDKYNYWIFGIRSPEREKLITYLKSNGVATGVHYMPLTLHPYFKRWYSPNPTAESIWKEFITLPLHIRLRKREIRFIVSLLRKFENAL